MQEKMQEMQERLSDHEVTGYSGGGMLTVTMNGKGEVRQVKIDPKLVDPEDVTVLEDLMVAAGNDAEATVEQYTQDQMQELTGGMQLPPGFKFPGM